MVKCETRKIKNVRSGIFWIWKAGKHAEKLWNEPLFERFTIGFVFVLGFTK